jgi:hypothetical protein
MSIEALTVVLNHSQAKGAVKLILIGIANHINPDNDGAWPSQAKLASYANCSERYVHDAVAELVQLGELRIAARGGKSSGGNKSNRYWINIKCPDDCDGTTNHRIGKSRTLSDQTMNSVHETMNSVADTLNPTSGEPYIETLKETLKEPVKKKPHLLPEDWQPSERLLAMFATKWPLINEKIQTEKFKLHRWAKGDKMVDWDLAYQKWMNQAQEWAEEKQPKESTRKIVNDF